MQSGQELPRSSRIIASLEPPADALEFPKPKRRGGGSMTGILSTSLLAFGILILLTRGPIHAPPFNSLTQYVCDPLPSLPSLGNRLQQYRLRVICRAADQLVYQSQPIVDGSDPSSLRSCKRDGGLIRIWRMAPPDAYGAVVFHATCGGEIVVHYKDRAANYESNQRFVIVLAVAMITLSVVPLLMKFLLIRKRRVTEP